jgi:hypothetical protein
MPAGWKKLPAAIRSAGGQWDVMISRSIGRTVLVGFSALTFVGQGLAADLYAVPDADY